MERGTTHPVPPTGEPPVCFRSVFANGVWVLGSMTAVMLFVRQFSANDPKRGRE